MSSRADAPGRRRTGGVLLIAWLVLAGSVAWSLAAGPLAVSLGGVVSALAGGEVPVEVATVVREIRLPRTVTACLVGGALALAGLIYQALLKNALASEYTLGVSSGAALGAVTVALAGASSALATSAGAFAGALATMALVTVLARANLSFETSSMVLAGIIFTSLASAALNLILTLVSPHQLQSFFFWMMGSFGQARWPAIVPVGVVMLLLFAILAAYAWPLDVLAVDEAMAVQVGIDVRRTRLSLIAIASLLTALAVTLAGTIGFVGLVVPHLARLLVGVRHRLLIPLVALCGAALCVLSDLLARTLLAPSELPVGVVTAFVGAPVFLSLLRRRGGAGE